MADVYKSQVHLETILHLTWYLSCSHTDSLSSESVVIVEDSYNIRIREKFRNIIKQNTLTFIVSLFGFVMNPYEIESKSHNLIHSNKEKNRNRHNSGLGATYCRRIAMDLPVEDLEDRSAGLVNGR